MDLQKRAPFTSPPLKQVCFTLIELLVVVAIIAILAAMLLPVLTKARKSAQAIACVNNQKQIALGMIMYVDEQQEYLPYAFKGYPGGGENRWVPWDVAIADSLGLGRYGRENATYYKRTDVLACPTDFREREVPSWASATPSPGEGIRSYSMPTPRSGVGEPYTMRGAGAWASENFTGNGVKIASCDAETLMLVEFQPLNNGNCTNVAGFQTGAHCDGPQHFLYSGDGKLPHDRTQNWLFCDGRVERLPVTDTYDPSLPSTPYEVKGMWTRPKFRK